MVRELARFWTREAMLRSARNILAVVQVDREAGPLVDADLEDDILMAALLVESAHAVAHLQRRGNRPVRRGERRHHGVADGLDHRAGLSRDDSYRT